MSAGGTGTKTWNVGSKGSALDLANNADCSVFGLLQQADRQQMKRKLNANAFTSVFDAINKTGEN